MKRVRNELEVMRMDHEAAESAQDRSWSVPPWSEPPTQRRRLVHVALATLTLAGCEPALPRGSSSAALDYVVFDPSASHLPLPNDLALQQASATAAASAQAAMLQQVAAEGGYPADLELPVTIDLEHVVVGGDGERKSAPQPVDASTLDPGTLLVLETDLATGVTVPGPVLEPEYVAGADHGTLVLRPPIWSYDPTDPTKQGRRWKADHRYAVILRGGPDGARLAGGGELSAMPTLYLLTVGVANGQELPGASLTLPENEYLLPGDSRDARATAGAQLELLRQAYLPLFGLVDRAWGAGAAQQLVSVQTFTIAPAPATQLAAGSATAP